MFDEWVEHAGRVAAAADASDDRIRQASELFARLFNRFAANHRLEVANDAWKRMRADDRAENVVSGCNTCHPITHRFIDRVAQRARAARDWPNFGAKQLHAEHVRRLTANILFAHVNDAVQTEVGTGGGGCNAVLPGARLCDYAFLAHADREQRLTDRVVDFVRAGVVKILALQPDLSAAALFTQPLREIKRRRTSNVVLQQRGQLGLKRGVLTRAVIFCGEFVECANERFGDVAPAKLSEPAGRIGNLNGGGALCHYIDSQLQILSDQVTAKFTT